jgi:hypothetical protein
LGLIGQFESSAGVAGWAFTPTRKQRSRKAFVYKGYRADKNSL